MAIKNVAGTYGIGHGNGTLKFGQWRPGARLGHHGPSSYVELLEGIGVGLQRSGDMPKVKGATGHCTSAAAGDSFGTPKRVRPFERLVEQRAIVEVIFDVAENGSSIRLGY
jgi:hypothetical protein